MANWTDFYRESPKQCVFHTYRDKWLQNIVGFSWLVFKCFYGDLHSFRADPFYSHYPFACNYCLKL